MTGNIASREKEIDLFIELNILSNQRLIEYLCFRKIYISRSQ